MSACASVVSKCIKKANTGEYVVTTTTISSITIPGEIMESSTNTPYKISQYISNISPPELLAQISSDGNDASAQSNIMIMQQHAYNLSIAKIVMNKKARK